MLPAAPTSQPKKTIVKDPFLPFVVSAQNSLVCSEARLPKLWILPEYSSFNTEVVVKQNAKLCT